MTAPSDRNGVDYMLRRVDISLWLDVKARAASEGRNVRFVIIELLKIYAKHGFHIAPTVNTERRGQ